MPSANTVSWLFFFFCGGIKQLCKNKLNPANICCAVIPWAVPGLNAVQHWKKADKWDHLSLQLKKNKTQTLFTWWWKSFTEGQSCQHILRVFFAMQWQLWGPPWWKKKRTLSPRCTKLQHCFSPSNKSSSCWCVILGLWRWPPLTAVPGGCSWALGSAGLHKKLLTPEPGYRLRGFICMFVS